MITLDIYRDKRVVIRSAQPDDLSGLMGLLEQLFALEADFDFDESRAETALSQLLVPDPSHHIFVAVLDGQVIGMCSIQSLISTAEGGRVGLVEDVIVHHAYRGLKIGTRMLQAIEKWASDQQLLRLQLLADRENQRAIDFYERLDWTLTQLICLRKK
jgi:GNAT superfamily N-acetyltransferase